jgi:hypothetical protein
MPNITSRYNHNKMEEKGKNKSIIISQKTHEKLKSHCVKNGMKITPLVEKIINEFLSKN